MTSLQQNIAFIVEHYRLTAKEFGDIVGATEGMVKQYKNGAVPPPPILFAIADYAGVSLDVLMREKITEKNYNSFRPADIPYDVAREIQKQLNTILKKIAALEKQETKGKLHFIGGENVINKKTNTNTKKALKSSQHIR